MTRECGATKEWATAVIEVFLLNWGLNFIRLFIPVNLSNSLGSSVTIAVLVTASDYSKVDLLLNEEWAWVVLLR